MAFSRSLDTKAMSEFVVRRFQWDRWGKAFPLSPFPKDFRSLCLDFDFATAEQAAAQHEHPELPQVIFYARLLNEAERLGMLRGLRLRSLEVYDARFRPKGHSDESTRAGGQGKSSSGGATAEDEKLLAIACAVSMAFPPTHSMREVANYVRGAFT
ncbi:hypothetical protein Cgig2_026274 [Carnegiea gigantea]|uniref:Uncharacterized protein n=1 Tax=Carnegiea gigantea TaxID=171969 RepID=A0A9Q1Q4U4_9CARY|nr:hypothetical protein Cgig2_026274 [Carnegiea gigantea]